VFLAMELATAGTLRAWAKGKRWREIVDAYAAAGRGLAAAHAVGLVHRDFKPDNVLVGADGRVRVTDFGLARSHDGPIDPAVARSGEPLAVLTVTGAVMGTPAYMANEQFSGEAADARTDQFAFCVALWEALFGARPFAGNTAAEVAEAVAAARIAEPPAGHRVPRTIERALRRGLEPDPAARWPAMDDLLTALAPPKGRVWPFALAGAAVVAGAIAIVALRPSHAVEHVVVQAPADAMPDAMDRAAMQALAEIVDLNKRALDALSRHELVEAQRLGTEAIERARSSGSRYLLADTLFHHASLLREGGDLPNAERALREARRIGEAMSDDGRKLEAAVELADVLEREGKREEAADVRALVDATALRPTTNDAARAEAIEDAARKSDDVEQAIAKWNQALALRKNVGRLVPEALNRLGLARTLDGANRLPEARTILLSTLERLDQAAQTKETAMATFGVLELLATIERQQKAYDDAEKHARRAIETAESKVPEMLGQNEYEVLGSVLLGKGDRGGAKVAYAHALSLVADKPVDLAEAQVSIAVAYHGQHDDKEAIAYAKQGVATAEKAIGENNPETLTYKLALCKLLLADHQNAAALPIAEKILPKIEAAELGATPIGDARFALARALPKSQRARALQLAAAAKESLAKGGAVGADHGKQVDEWLASPDN
jgi:tetratricopeptide (TPR) repeat protein